MYKFQPATVEGQGPPLDLRFDRSTQKVTTYCKASRCRTDSRFPFKVMMAAERGGHRHSFVQDVLANWMYHARLPKTTTLLPVRRGGPEPFRQCPGQAP